jgi:hypothetical protein
MLVEDPCSGNSCFAYLMLVTSSISLFGHGSCSKASHHPCMHKMSSIHSAPASRRASVVLEHEPRSPLPHPRFATQPADLLLKPPFYGRKSTRAPCNQSSSRLHCSSTPANDTKGPALVSVFWSRAVRSNLSANGCLCIGRSNLLAPSGM